LSGATQRLIIGRRRSKDATDAACHLELAPKSDESDDTSLKFF